VPPPAFDYTVRAAGVSVSGDLAYVAGRAHDGVHPRGPGRSLCRVTTVFRREDEVWKAVHRHADTPPVEAAADEMLRSLNQP
jgi:ketosteroid isomerase-like protein